MKFTVKIPEYSIKEQSFLYVTLPSESIDKKFPVIMIDKDSYVGELEVRNGFVSCDEQLYNVQIGKYTSIATKVEVLIDENHDYKKVFQGRISNFPYSAPTHIIRKGQVIIENDCWIGDGVKILGGVTIHNGAVVGAYSVVTKDVPPYAIVAGNPARVVAYRFKQEEIKALQKIAWWDWSNEIIDKNKKSLNSDISEFIEEHINSANDYWKSIPKCDIPRIIPNAPCYLFFVDLEGEFPLCENVITQFAAKFSNMEAELILYINEDASREVISRLNRILEKYFKYNCVVNVLSGFSYDERILFKAVDFYITNRSKKNIQRMCLADLLNVNCISSVDSIIFK